MFELKALFTQPLQWQLWCCRIYWLRTLTHLFKKQVTIYVALIANHTVCCRTEVYLSSSWAMPHKSFFFCIHHQGSTSVIGWGFWGISIPGRLCICFVQGADTVSTSQAVSLLGAPEREELHWDHTPSPHIFCPGSSERGFRRRLLLALVILQGPALKIELIMLTPNLRTETHTATHTQRKWIYFLLP